MTTPSTPALQKPAPRAATETPEKSAALKALAERLARALAGRPRLLGWGSPEAMQTSLAAVRARLGKKRGESRAARIARGILAFRLNADAVDFVQLKYACEGAGDPVDWESRRLIEDERLFPKLLERVAALRDDPRRFSACCRGLRHASTVLHARATPPLPVVARHLATLEVFLTRYGHGASGGR
ncbi:MAG: hypothetical protein LBB51_03290 [Zoogloeaceae bacterium]|jgi:hypothetical protein|nr:hypothetical protein [Zoogloeaceae bacterium]